MASGTIKAVASKADVDALNSKITKKITVTKTTNSNGFVVGSTSDLIGVADAVIIHAYVAKGSFGTFRKAELWMYGSAGYGIRVFDDETPIASSSVTLDVYYI